MRKLINALTPPSLILLYSYTAISKLSTFDDFSRQLANQNFDPFLSGLLHYTLLPAELLVAGLLSFRRTLITGLALSAILLSLFTGYILLVLGGYWDRVPCTCGGVLSQLSWKAHLWFNLSFLIPNIVTLLFNLRDKYRPTPDLIYTR